MRPASQILLVPVKMPPMPEAVLVPMVPVSEMFGKNWALTAPICALRPISCCSARRTSGRRSSRSEGRPAGGVGRESWLMGLPRGTGPGLRPRTKLRLFSCSPIAWTSGGMAASAASTWDWICDTCTIFAVP